MVATKLLLLRVRPVGVTPGLGAQSGMVKHLGAQQHQISKALACTAQWQDKGKKLRKTLNILGRIGLELLNLHQHVMKFLLLVRGHPHVGAYRFHLLIEW